MIKLTRKEEEEGAAASRVSAGFPVRGHAGVGPLGQEGQRLQGELEKQACFLPVCGGGWGGKSPLSPTH